VASNLNQPGGVAVDGAGDVFVADTFNNRVLEQQDVAVNFGKVNVCPGAQTTPAPCNQTLTLNYNVAATTTFGTTNVVTQGAPNLDFKLSSGGTCTGTVAAGTACTVNVSLAHFRRELAWARCGSPITRASCWSTPWSTDWPGTGDCIWTRNPDRGGQRIEWPSGVAVDEAGDVFIADTNNNRVVKVLAGGGAQTTVGSGLSFPSAAAVDGAGDVFIADFNNNRVVDVPAGGGTQLT